MIGVPWQQDGGFGVPGSTLAAHAVMTAHDDSTVAVVATNKLFHYAGAGAQALDLPQVIGAARSDGGKSCSCTAGGYRKRLDADFVESASELLWDGITSRPRRACDRRGWAADPVRVLRRRRHDDAPRAALPASLRAVSYIRGVSNSAPVRTSFTKWRAAR